ncbi:GDSL-type esterase/lipase family protein [Aeromicrobium fastidiosum]|uniref:Lipase n=1 Tax=Aeromicrobium fastidiosum TaxID=52699 RepID=A0A641AR90_9ACTN|nr:GDSL-type esterase/lipase family protein [Aeromicrobium fastidiosum]KAA1380600.1 lipase [Aeromicrobium fastidiosum]MBP2390200.1 lysophospholipase L1-like esterase [Aeromicrobium fastidiosum]
MTDSTGSSRTGMFNLDVAAIETSIRGAVHVEASADGGVVPRRLDPELARRAHFSGFELVSAQAAGISIELITSANVLEIDAHLTRFTYGDSAGPAQWVAETPDHSTTVDSDASAGDLVFALPADVFELRPGPASTITFSLGTSSVARPVRVWLPHTAQTRIFAIRADGPVSAHPRSVAGPRWVHYGSSISHGSDIASPRDIWPVTASEQLGMDAINLGLAGNALLDPFVATTISALPADVITLKIGINVVNWDAFTARTLAPALHGFLDLVRAGHPATPLALITPIWCGMHEHSPGPIDIDLETGQFFVPSHGVADRLTLSEVRRVIQDVAELRGDPTLHVVDGLSLLGEDDAHLLPDGLHPGEEGSAVIARRFADLARDASTPLGGAFAPALRMPRTRRTV